MTPICDFCKICRNPFKLEIEQIKIKLSITTQINIKYNFNKLISEVTLLEEHDLLVSRLKEKQIKRNQVIPISILEDQEEYLYFLELDEDKFWRFEIRFENMSMRVRPSLKLRSFLEEKRRSSAYPLCSHYLKVPIELLPEDIYSVRIGLYTKKLNINLIISITCSKIKVLNTQKVALKIGSVIVLSFLSNVSTTLFTSMLYFKDILDAPHMVRKKLSPKVTHMLSILVPFECKDGIAVGSDKDSFYFFQKIKKWFFPNIKQEKYLVREKNIYLNKSSEYVQNLSNCRSVLLISDMIIILFTLIIFSIFLLIFCLRIIVRKYFIKLFELFKICFNFLFFIVMLVYLDNWIYLLNNISFVQINLLGFYDIIFIVIRCAYVMIPLIHFFFQEKNEKKKANELSDKNSVITTFEIKKTNVKPSLFLNLLKNLIILLFVLLVNSRPWIWMLVTMMIQLAYLAHLFYFVDWKARKHWPVFFQESFYLFFLVLSVEFATNSSADISDTYFFFYFIGNTSSVFFIAFEILDKKFEFLRKITIKKPKKGKITEKFVSKNIKRKKLKLKQIKKNMTIFEEMVKQCNKQKENTF